MNCGAPLPVAHPPQIENLSEQWSAIMAPAPGVPSGSGTGTAESSLFRYESPDPNYAIDLAVSESSGMSRMWRAEEATRPTLEKGQELHEEVWGDKSTVL